MSQAAFDTSATGQPASTPESPPQDRGAALRLGLALSALGYTLGMAHDLASVQAVPRVKPYLFAAMVGAHCGSLVRLLRGSSRLSVPSAVARLAAALSLLSFLGMFYSIMVEIPLRKAWLKQGHTDALVTTGTYALVRHPGVLWLGAGLGLAAVAARSRRLLLAWPAMMLGDVVHVWFQERVVLPRVFGDSYREYQRRTPFLVPTRASASRMARSLREQFAVLAGDALAQARSLVDGPSRYD